MSESSNPEQPDVQPFDWIKLGQPGLVTGTYDAVVCSFDPTHPGWVEVVYLELLRTVSPHKKQPKPRAMQRYVVWEGGRWERAGYSGDGYADTYNRLTEFVHELRKGHPDFRS